MPNLKITQAGLISLVTVIVGQLVAFVPALAHDKQILISAAAAVIAAAFLIANAVHALAGSNVTASEVKLGVANLVRQEIAKIDFNNLVKDAVDTRGGVTVADVENLVKTEVQSVIQHAFGGQAPSTAPSSASATPTA